MNTLYSDIHQTTFYDDILCPYLKWYNYIAILPSARIIGRNLTWTSVMNKQYSCDTKLSFRTPTLIRRPTGDSSETDLCANLLTKTPPVGQCELCKALPVPLRYPQRRSRWGDERTGLPCVRPAWPRRTRTPPPCWSPSGRACTCCSGGWGAGGWPAAPARHSWTRAQTGTSWRPAWSQHGICAQQRDGSGERSRLFDLTRRG